MARQYHLRLFLRDAPNVFLRRYLSEKGVGSELDWEALGEMDFAPISEAIQEAASEETGFRIGLVAGAGSAALEKLRTRRWVWQLPFETLGRALDALWEEAKLRLRRVEPTRKRR